MPAVRCGIDQHIVRFPLQPSLDDRLQVFVLRLKFLEREVVHVNDKFIVAVLNLGDYIV